MSASIDIQLAIRAALVTDPAVTALVPVENIFDQSKRPENKLPCIVLGENMEYDADIELSRSYIRVSSTIHVWERDLSSTGVKAIAAAIRSAVARRVTGFVDVRFESARFIRDSDGATQHAIVTFTSIVWSPTQ